MFLLTGCGENAGEALNCDSETTTEQCSAEDLTEMSDSEQGETTPLDAEDNEQSADLTSEDLQSVDLGIDLPLIDLVLVDLVESDQETSPDLVFDGPGEPVFFDLVEVEEMTADLTLDLQVTDEDSSTEEEMGEEGCGEGVLPFDSIRGTEGIAFAEDGTFYYSQSAQKIPTSWVGRVRGGTDVAEGNWVELPGELTVWGLAYREDGMLYAAGVSRGIIYQIDTTEEVATSTVFATGAGQPNGLIIGPDGHPFYSDFYGGHVYWVDESGDSTRVDTGSSLSMPNGLFYDDDGTLIVLEYGTGDIWQLTLSDDYLEEDRVLLGTVPGGAIDGIGKDVTGRYYITNNGSGQLYRYDADFTTLEMLMGGITAAANLVFGQGEVDCHDIYVASYNSLARYEGDSAGRP
jgi:sugar lactone lactonase YvrE